MYTTMSVLQVPLADIKQEIDGFMGCSSELMALTAEVIAAARRYQIHPGKERSSTSYLGSLERRLHMVVQSCSHISLILSESSPLGSLIESFLVQPEVLVRSKILALTAEARRQASLLLLYVGVRGFCTSRTEVRVRVANCLLCLSAVSQLMPAEDAPLWGMTPIIWPLFMAGSCVTTESQRIQVMEMFENLKRSKCLGVSLPEAACRSPSFSASNKTNEKTECPARVTCHQVHVEAQ